MGSRVGIVRERRVASQIIWNDGRWLVVTARRPFRISLTIVHGRDEARRCVIVRVPFRCKLGNGVNGGRGGGRGS